MTRSNWRSGLTPAEIAWMERFSFIRLSRRKAIILLVARITELETHLTNQRELAVAQCAQDRIKAITAARDVAICDRIVIEHQCQDLQRRCEALTKLDSEHNARLSAIDKIINPED